MSKTMSEDQVKAVMAAVERDTIRRCVDVVRAYSKAKGKLKPSSRIAGAKAMAANELAAQIERLPPRETR